MELFGVYQDLISLRKDNLRLFVDGALNYLLADDARGLLAYERVLDDERAMIAFNISDGPRAFAVDAQDGAYRAAFPRGDVVNVADGTLLAELPPRTATVWIRE
jgi:glycosidase